MTALLWSAVGWVGQACFFSRFLVQWLQSERARATVVPRSFWWLSLVGTALLFAYTFEQGEPVLLAGYGVNAVLYTRNLQLAYGLGLGPRLGSRLLAALAFLVLAILVWNGMAGFEGENSSPPAWLAVGIVGQGLWCSRFVLQWLASERARASYFPRAFWWVSLAGNSLLLAYALHLGDAVFIVGLAVGPLVQIRNLMLGAGPRAVSEPELPAPSGARAELGRARSTA